MHAIMILVTWTLAVTSQTQFDITPNPRAPQTRILQICQTDSDCDVGSCASDGQCGSLNGESCLADVQCRYGWCASDGRCGKPNGLACTSGQDCRSNICNADGFCGYLQIALCDNANQCRSNICVSGYCYPACSQDSDCEAGHTYCETNSKRCQPVLDSNNVCSRDTMCQSQSCGQDGYCDLTNTQACSTSAQCRSHVCGTSNCTENCTIDSQCADGFYCDSQKRCSPQALSGQSCLRNAMCANAVCGSDGICGRSNGATCQTPQDCRSGICLASTRLCASSCKQDSDCDHLHFCDSSAACAPLINNGSACTLDVQCAAGVCNTDNLCGQRNGAPCGDDTLCVGLACQIENTTCGLAQGFTCQSSEACLSGFCDTANQCSACRNDLDCLWGACEQGVCATISTLERVELTGGGCQIVHEKRAPWLQACLVLAGVFLAHRWRRAHLGRRGLFWGLMLFMLPQSALATGFALERYTPSDPGQYTIRIERPRYGQKQQPRLVTGLHLGFAHNPLKYQKQFSDPKDNMAGGLVTSQLVGSLQVAGSWLDWLALSAYVPLMIYETGQTALGVDVHSPSMGNMQLQGIARIFGHSETDKISFHAGLALVLPAGSNSHAHDSMLGAIPKVVVSGRLLPMLGYSANAGLWVRQSNGLSAQTSLASTSLPTAPSIVTARAGSEFQLGMAAFYINDALRWSVGPELTYSTQITTSVAGTKQGSSLEVLLGTTGAWDANFGGGFAVGMGFFGQAGTPDWRILGRLFWAPWGNDNAYSKPEPPDRDHDGIEDNKDACPDVAGVFSPYPELNGCPGDRDHDGILDQADKCPNQPAGLRPDPRRRGCPMPTAQDKPVVSATPAEIAINTPVQGPVHIAIMHQSIQLSRPISFIGRSPKLTDDGLFIIRKLADYLRSHPKLEHITIHAYTDDVDPAAQSQILSQRRANIVKDALMQHNIDSKRMVPKGHGQAKPIAPNTSQVGRTANMRLEIKLGS